MKLWTWQNKKLALTEGRYESRKYSAYYFQNPEAYERLWGELETDQFLWCFIKEEEAKNNKSQNKGNRLHELDVPSNGRIDNGNIDSYVWHCILFNAPPTPSYEIGRHNDKRREYLDYWNEKIENNDLWGDLYLKEIKPNRSQLLIPYPVRKCWICKGTPSRYF